MAPDDADTGDRATPRREPGDLTDPSELTDRAIAKAVASLTQYIDGKYDVLAERTAGHWRLDDERWRAFGEAQGQIATERKDASTARDIATEKAIDKSERATAEAIGKLEQLVAVRTDALSEKIDTVKETANGTVQQKIGGNENRTATIALVGVAGTIIAIVIGVVSFALANAR